MDSAFAAEINFTERSSRALLLEILSLVKGSPKAELNQEYYTVHEFAMKVDRAPWTVREWCRNGRIHAEKTDCGRGGSEEWRISHKELMRWQHKGLLPNPNPYRHKNS